MSTSAQLEYAAGAVLGEGSFWHFGEQRLYWLDIESGLLHRYDPQQRQEELFLLGEVVGCVAPVSTEPGRTTELIVAAKTGVKQILIRGPLLEPEGTIAHTFPSETGSAVEQWSAEKPYKSVFITHPDTVADNRYNDGKCSPEGRFWFGSINARREPKAALFSYGGRGGRGCGSNGVQVHITEARNSNGLVWSPDGKTFYWIDTPTLRVDAFDYDMEWGRITHRRTVLELPSDGSLGKPDGMTIDAEGNLWIAHWMGGAVSQWNPNNGTMLQKYHVPVKRCTSMSFSGPNLDVLYITTSSQSSTNEPPAEPNAGGLFVLRPGVRGLPTNSFKTHGLDFG